MIKKTGILLVNLGTPDAPTFWAVRRYLKQFLSDPKVIDLPRGLWWPLLNLVILNVRPWRSAKLYQKIWQTEGSPLLVNSQKLAGALQQSLGQNFQVALGMRYGTPSIEKALQSLDHQNIDTVIVLPLYPQYSETTTGTTIDEVHRFVNAKNKTVKAVRTYADFPPYIEAMRDKIQHFWAAEGRAQKLVLSFHGLPERYVRAGDPYFEQCSLTAGKLAEALQLQPDEWLMTFQSRVGVEAWLKPYTIEAVAKLAEEGVTGIDVFCPGFAVDCLETLEEIALQNKAVFLDAGGKTFSYINALNDDDTHVKMLSKLIDKWLPHG